MTRARTFPVEASWRPLLKDLGVRSADVLRRAGLPEDLLARPESGLSTAEFFRFWHSLEASVDDPLFALRVVQAMSAETFVPPLFAALCSADLTKAVQRIAVYKRLVLPMALVVDRSASGLVITPHWLDAQGAVPASLVATELAFFVRLARLATREPVAAREVVMPVPPQPAAAYERFFGVAVRAGEGPSIRFDAADAARPFLTANEALWQVFEPELRRRLAELDRRAALAERVRAVLLEALPSGQLALDTVAARLLMSKRTLQRRLGEEGTSFQAVVQRTREDLARHDLTRTGLPCSEISFLLGFEDPNSYFRAFHGWTGGTPDALRQATTAAH